MTHVVTTRCADCLFLDCVAACPTEVFRHAVDQRLLVIDPEECIDCGGCVPLCPVEAIGLDDQVPGDHKDDIDLNARLAKTSSPVARQPVPSRRLPGTV